MCERRFPRRARGRCTRALLPSGDALTREGFRSSPSLAPPAPPSFHARHRAARKGVGTQEGVERTAPRATGGRVAIRQLGCSKISASTTKRLCGFSIVVKGPSSGINSNKRCVCVCVCVCMCVCVYIYISGRPVLLELSQDCSPTTATRLDQSSSTI